MFGKVHLKSIIHEYHEQPVSVMIDAVIDAAADFRGTAPRQDDVTLVVIKFQEFLIKF